MAIVLGAVLGLVANYHNSFKKVYVKLGANLQLSIYKDLGGDNTHNYNSHSQPLFRLKSSQTVKLKKGVYDLVVNDPAHQYENPITKVVIADNTNNITINPFLTDQKLSDLLTAQRSAIQQVLTSQYPSLTSFYTITPDRLYEHGDWYGAVLSPIGLQVDKLRVIMGYKNGRWVVIAKPQISIGIPSNLSIPSEIVDSVDQL